ncbi:MAG: hypothetical protein AB7P12_13975 [Alphaproteobacteria bacterium]
MTVSDSNTRGAAKLTSSLLARKGTAAPAALSSVAVALRPVDGASRAQKCASPAYGGDCSGKAPPRMTFRLDEARHLRLRLAAAHLQRSRQDVLTEALDRFLDQISPEILSNNCVCLTARARGDVKS